MIMRKFIKRQNGWRSYSCYKVVIKYSLNAAERGGGKRHLQKPVIFGSGKPSVEHCEISITAKVFNTIESGLKSAVGSV